MDIPIDITNTTLETERLILRPWRETDLNDFYEYASVSGVGEMAGWPHHKSIEESKKVLDSFLSERNVFAVVFKENAKVIGSLGFHSSWANNDETYRALRQKEIGYVLSRDYWGLGLMPEAVTKAIEYAFGTLKLEAVAIGHFQANNQSRRVIEKCGFHFVKAGTYDAKQLGRTFTDMKYILLNRSIQSPRT